MIAKVNSLSNKSVVIISGLFMILILLIGFSYAFWNNTHMQEDTNEISFQCFDIEYSENTAGVTLNNAIPQTDSQGMNNSPYIITITNKCEQQAIYTVLLHKLDTSTLDDQYVKVNLTEMSASNKQINSYTSKLSELSSKETTITNALYSKQIASQILESKETRKLNIRSWMDENTPMSKGTEKKYDFKITIETTNMK